MKRALRIVILVSSMTASGGASVLGQVPAGPEFQVTSTSLGYQGEPSSAGDSLGNFVVVWQSENVDGANYAIVGQRFNSSGSAVDGEFQVNTFTPNRQAYSAVAFRQNGDFVIVWSSNGQDGFGYGIFGQRYSSSWQPQGVEFQVSTYSTFDQNYPSVAITANGTFLVAWGGTGQDDASGVFAQRFASSGTRLASEFRVNS
jgi:hypothetical protein